jgi:hypothetical protein
MVLSCAPGLLSTRPLVVTLLEAPGVQKTVSNPTPNDNVC